MVEVAVKTIEIAQLQSDLVNLVQATARDRASTPAQIKQRVQPLIDRLNEWCARPALRRYPDGILHEEEK